MLSWVEDARETKVSAEQLQELAMPFSKCSHIVAIHFCVRTKEAPGPDCWTELQADTKQLLAEMGKEKVWFTFDSVEAKAKAEIVFRQINIEHKGHNIAQ